MPYHRYEADAGDYGGGAKLYENPDLLQELIASEASDMKYVGLPSNGSFISWNSRHEANGITVRFTMPDAPDGEGLTGSLDLYVNDQKVKTIDLTSYWAWQYFPSSQPVNTPGPRPRMRFDEVHFLLDESVSPGDEIKIQKTNGDAIEYGVDFIEIEKVGAPLPKPTGYVSVTDYGAIANDDQDDLPAFYAALAAADQAGTGVYVPPGQYDLDETLDILVSNIGFKGAGMWYTDLFFIREGIFTGGIYGRCTNVDISDFNVNTLNNQRRINGEYVIHKGFMGTYGDDSTITNTWVTHFEVGAWIAGYDAPYPIDVTQRLKFENNRIRNNYADGINLCQGTSNSIVAQNNFRSNGDDAMAVWPDSSFQAPVAVNNIFRYNTVENNYRAGGAAIFGGDGHEVHHCIIKDGLAGSGLRLTTDFPGYHFENTEQIRFYEITLINCGTSTDLFGPERGAIEVNATNFPINNVFFENIDIIDAQRHGIQIGSNNEVNLQFDNISINGTGIDPVTDAKYTVPTEGAAIMTYARQGTAVFNNLTLENIERDPPFLKGFENYNLVIENTSVPLAGIALSKEELNLVTGDSEAISVTFSPTNANNKKINWTSSDESVAIYNVADSAIEAVGIGTATITATSEEGNFTDSVVVNVQAAVNITADNTDASEDGTTAQFTVSIPGLAGEIAIAYEVSGTASGNDYAISPALSNTITLDPSNLSKTFTVSAVDDNEFEGNETLSITLLPGSGYKLSTTQSISIKIVDNETPDCTAPIVAFVGNTPTIDGVIDAAWASAPAMPIANTIAGNPSAEFSGSWKALDNTDFLYVLVNVTDATLTNDSGAEWWNDDTVEIFIDGNNSKGSSYDGQDDVQLGFRWDDDTVHFGGNSLQNGTGIDHSMIATANGYILEVAIPWSSLNSAVRVGDQIGFDVVIDGDDNGGARDSQVASLATTDAGWTNPSVFGSVYVTNCDGGVIPPPTNTAPIANAGPDQSVASTSSSISLRGSGSDADGDTITYSWTQTSGTATTIVSTSSATTTVNGLTAGNSYAYTLTVNDGRTSTSDTVTITVTTGGVVTPPSTSGFTIQNVWSKAYLRDAGATVQYGDAPTSAEYFWTLEDVANGVEIKNVATGEYMHVENLTGAIQCTERNPNWFSSRWTTSDAGEGAVRVQNQWQSNQYIHIENLTGNAQLGTIFPAWGSAKWIFSESENGLKTSDVSTKIAQITLYPNPVSNSLTVTSSIQTDDAKVSIYSLSGRQVAEQIVVGNQTMIATEGLASGMYILRFISGETSQTLRFVKE